MQRQGVTDSVSLQSTLNSSFINEFNAIEQALNSEIDFISPRSSPYLQDSASVCFALIAHLPHSQVT